MEGHILSCTGVHKTFEYPVVPLQLFQDRMLRAHKHKEKWRIHALNDVSLAVARGEWVGIYGPNGSGKTTLLKVLGGLLDPDEGRVERQGRLSCFFTLGVGFHHERLASENIYFHGLFHGMPSDEIRRTTEKIIDFAGVRSHAHLPLKCYSMGMQMRLAFAAMVHTDADVYLLDEVLAVGDAAFQKKCKAEMRSMKVAGKSAVLVLHGEEDLQEFCDRILFINDGRIVGERVLRLCQAPALPPLRSPLPAVRPAVGGGMRRRLRRAARLCGGGVLFLFIAVAFFEGALRLLENRFALAHMLLYSSVVPTDYGSIRTVPMLLQAKRVLMVPGDSFAGMRINSHGFRTPEYAVEKPAGTRRIVVVGDSFASDSGGVPFPLLWHQRMGEVLAQRTDPSLEVINLGVPSTSPFFVQKVFELEGGRLQPDLVIATFFVGNDLTDEEIYVSAPFERWSYIVRLWRNVRYLWRGDTVTWKFVGQLTAFRNGDATSGDVAAAPYVYMPEEPTLGEHDFLTIERGRANILRPRMRPAVEALIKKTLPAVHKLAEDVRRSGAAFLVVIIPDELQVNAALRAQVRQWDPPDEEPFDLMWITHRVTSELEAAGIPTIDLLPVFQRESLERRLYKPRDTHWNAEGNQLAADTVAAFIRRTPSLMAQLLRK